MLVPLLFLSFLNPNALRVYEPRIITERYRWTSGPGKVHWPYCGMASRAIKVQAGFQPGAACSTQELVEKAQLLETLGFDRIMSAELNHDPFIPLALAAHHTNRIELGTGIAVAFARNPMTIANAAHDINAYSGGRFRLGLGSQIKPHITRRFSMPWHGAAKQMREFIEAIRAIWDSWYDGVPLAYNGEFYQYSLMTPEFTPATDGLARPKILLAAVGPLMLETAAAVSDGLIAHPFCTERYLTEVILPRIEPVLEQRQMALADFEIQFPVFIVTGENEEEFEKSKHAIKQRIGFYGSTPSYKPVLDLHGWGDLQPKLRTLTKENGWHKLADQIDDEVLDTFAVVGDPLHVATTIRERFGGVIDSVNLNSATSPTVLAQQMRILRPDSP